MDLSNSPILQNKGSVSAIEAKIKAEMEYEIVGSSDGYFLLKIKLLTGRHHQIRAQLAAIGCPVKGDVKYGARRSNLDRSIHLHAWKLGFEHPLSGERLLLVVPPPEDVVWKALMAGEISY